MDLSKWLSFYNIVEGFKQKTTMYCYGLKLCYNSEIVAAMTFRKPLPKNSIQTNDWELKRYCPVTNYQIVGGAQKLFKHAIKEAKLVIGISFS